MKTAEYIHFKELGDHQRKNPGIYPVFKRVHQIDGELVGEVEGYSDGFGNRVELDDSETLLN